MKEQLYNVAHKIVIGTLICVTAAGVYHSSAGAYGIVSRRVVSSLSTPPADADKK